jgi:hypothetical protein
MKTHTTNYIDTFIEVSEDCPAVCGEIPTSKGDKKSIAMLQYELLQKQPYTLTSDDVLFQIYAERHDLTPAEYEEARTGFFSKGQACLRASPLGKRYGFGVHSNSEGKVAIYARESAEYEQFVKDTTIKKVKAMRSSK